jgi:hypothetical protein
LKALNLVTISKRRILKKISREKPRILSDMMKTLHEKVFLQNYLPVRGSRARNQENQGSSYETRRRDQEVEV